MGELFLFSFGELKGFLSGKLVFLTCFIIVFVLTVLCLAISLGKQNYSVKNRLWLVFDFVSILLIDFWLEFYVFNSIKYLILLLAVECISLSICLFVNKKQKQDIKENKSIKDFLNKCYLSQNQEKSTQSLENKSKEIRSEVIRPSLVKQNEIKDDIDFSHVKTVLKKLDFYPLKEQDKKSAKELERAIIEAEENGLDQRLKQSINDGLGQLLKLMSKYAV